MRLLGVSPRNDGAVLPASPEEHGPKLGSSPDNQPGSPFVISPWPQARYLILAGCPAGTSPFRGISRPACPFSGAGSPRGDPPSEARLVRPARLLMLISVRRVVNSLFGVGYPLDRRPSPDGPIYSGSAHNNGSRRGSYRCHSLWRAAICNHEKLPNGSSSRAGVERAVT